MRYDDIMREKNAYDALEDKSNATDPGMPIEIEYCDMFFDSSVTYSASNRPWHFLVRHAQYQPSNRLFNQDGSPVSYKGFNYAYSKPEDLLRPYLIDEESNVDWAVDSENIYFSQEVSRLDYITNDFEDMADAPELFFNLIASRLAVEIAPFLAPDTAVVQRAAQQFQLNVSALSEIDKNALRERRPEKEDYLSWY